MTKPSIEVALLAKMLGIEARILARLDRAILRRLEWQDAGDDVEALELSDEFLAGLQRRGAVEKLSTAYDQCELDGTKIAFAHCSRPCFLRGDGAEPYRVSRVSCGIDLFRMPLIFCI